jgi:transcriptional regulator with XRE-family HTH domain
MIDSHKTGAYIAQLRKERDWTQVELADRLHVTHQAVSRWETGDSFPDLATLAQLAQVFKVRVDNLMYANSGASSDTGRDQVIEELAAGHADQVADLLKAKPSDIDAVIESGPLTRPSLMNKVVQNMRGYQFNLQQVIGLAPFVSQELLDTLVSGLSEKLDIQSLLALAPFLSRPKLQDLVGQFEGAIDIQHLIGLAPFVERDRLDELTKLVVQDKIEGYQLIALAPFVSRPVLDTLVERVPATEMGIDQVTSLAPFIDRAKLASMVSRAGMEPLRPDDLTALAPFLERAVLKQLIQHIPPESIDASTIVALSPFLDRQMLEELIGGRRQAGSAQSG